MRERLILVALGLLLFLPLVAELVDVDRDAGLRLIWLLAELMAIVGYLLGRYSLWGGITAFVLSGLLFSYQIGAITDPSVRIAFSQGSGPSYLVQSYGVLAVVLMAPLLGLVQRHLRRSVP